MASVGPADSLTVDWSLSYVYELYVQLKLRAVINSLR